MVIDSAVICPEWPAVTQGRSVCQIHTFPDPSLIASVLSWLWKRNSHVHPLLETDHSHPHLVVVVLSQQEPAPMPWPSLAWWEPTLVIWWIWVTSPPWHGIYFNASLRRFTRSRTHKKKWHKLFETMSLRQSGWSVPWSLAKVWPDQRALVNGEFLAGA